MYRVNREKKLGLAERGAIIALTHAGKSQTQIANAVGVARSTVKLWQDRFEDSEDVKRKVGSGRPRSTTPEQDQSILEAVRRQPITTAQAIAGSAHLIYY